MIPKIIHYCWFGGKKMPKLAKKCLKSWNKYCSDYKIMCWNEENFDINSNQFVKEAYKNKKFAFVTDYVRLYALYNYGGVYMDTDVEVVKPIDKFLENKAFSGFENGNYAITGIMASEEKIPIIHEFLEYYTNKSFIKQDGTFDIVPNTHIITNILDNKGLVRNNKYQVVDGYAVYPSEYFCPITYETKEKKITDNTHTIHWFAGSWVPLKTKVKCKIYMIIEKILGKDNTKKVYEFTKKTRDRK